ncbi:hypothetical protein [Neobacillus sp. D3-1R]|uniref:hypothetical protein n=1 Tax=Neobacillus sp. D3-1R TaxID=3445778 RepID=UPI003FA0E0C3
MKYRNVVLFLFILLLSGCTSKNELADTQKELESVKKELIYSNEKLNSIENQNLELNEELVNLNKLTDADIDSNAIAVKLLTSNFSSNHANGDKLPILHALVFAEHISTYFAYNKNGEIQDTDSSISSYLGNVHDLNVNNYFLNIVFSESVEIPLTVRNDTNKIVTNNILLVIDPEKKLPRLYIKTTKNTYSIYECDVRGMFPYDPDLSINQLIEHYQLEMFNQE